MDPIADMLNSLKLAARAGQLSVVLPYSNLKNEVAKVLEMAGYLKRVTQVGKKNRKYLECFINYDKTGAAKLTGARRVSKPSARVYRGATALPAIKSGQGIAIISTPQGVMTDKSARAAKVGGEVLAEIW